MQLTVELNGEVVSSRPFDFAAFAVGYDLMLKETGPAELGDLLLIELFKGTKATKDVLNLLDLHDRANLGERAVKALYDEVSSLNELKKNQTNKIPRISTRD